MDNIVQLLQCINLACLERRQHFFTLGWGKRVFPHWKRLKNLPASSVSPPLTPSRASWILYWQSASSCNVGSRDSGEKRKTGYCNFSPRNSTKLVAEAENLGVFSLHTIFLTHCEDMETMRWKMQQFLETFPHHTETSNPKILRYLNKTLEIDLPFVPN